MVKAAASFYHAWALERARDIDTIPLSICPFVCQSVCLFNAGIVWRNDCRGRELNRLQLVLNATARLIFAASKYVTSLLRNLHYIGCGCQSETILRSLCSSTGVFVV